MYMCLFVYSRRFKIRILPRVSIFLRVVASRGAQYSFSVWVFFNTFVFVVGFVAGVMYDEVPIDCVRAGYVRYVPYATETIQ